jgi:hypothetical protein
MDYVFQLEKFNYKNRFSEDILFNEPDTTNIDTIVFRRIKRFMLFVNILYVCYVRICYIYIHIQYKCMNIA